MPGLMELKSLQWAKEKEELNGLWSPWGKPTTTTNNEPSQIVDQSGTTNQLNESSTITSNGNCQLPPIQPSYYNSIASNDNINNSHHNLQKWLRETVTNDQVVNLAQSELEDRSGCNSKQSHRSLSMTTTNTTTATTAYKNYSTIGLGQELYTTNGIILKNQNQNQKIDEDTSGYHSSGNESRKEPENIYKNSNISIGENNAITFSSKEQELFGLNKIPVIYRDLSPNRSPTKKPQQISKNSTKPVMIAQRFEQGTNPSSPSPTFVQTQYQNSYQSDKIDEKDDSIYNSTNYCVNSQLLSKTPPAAMRSAFVIGEEGPLPNAFKEVANKEREQWLNELEKQREEQRLRKELEKEEKRPKWGDKGLGIGHFWEPKNNVKHGGERDENFNIQGIGLGLSGSSFGPGGFGNSGEIKTPSWLEKGLSRLEGSNISNSNKSNGNGYGNGPGYLESPNCTFFGIGSAQIHENTYENPFVPQQQKQPRNHFSGEFCVAGKNGEIEQFLNISDEGIGLLRGQQKAPLDREYLIEKEKKRLAALEHQEFIRKQMEDRQQKLRDMKEKREERIKEKKLGQNQNQNQKSRKGPTSTSHFRKGRSESDSDGNIKSKKINSSQQEQFCLPPINQNGNGNYNYPNQNQQMSESRSYSNTQGAQLSGNYVHQEPEQHSSFMTTQPDMDNGLNFTSPVFGHNNNNSTSNCNYGSSERIRRAKSLESTQDYGNPGLVRNKMSSNNNDNDGNSNDNKMETTGEIRQYNSLSNINQRNCRDNTGSTTTTSNSNGKLNLKPRWGVTQTKLQYVKNSEKDPLYKQRLQKRLEMKKRRENERNSDTTGTESESRHNKSSNSIIHSDYNSRSSRFRVKRLDNNSSKSKKPMPLKVLPSSNSPSSAKSNKPFYTKHDDGKPSRPQPAVGGLSVEKTFIKPNSSRASSILRDTEDPDQDDSIDLFFDENNVMRFTPTPSPRPSHGEFDDGIDIGREHDGDHDHERKNYSDESYSHCSTPIQKPVKTTTTTSSNSSKNRIKRNDAIVLSQIKSDEDSGIGDGGQNVNWSEPEIEKKSAVNSKKGQKSQISVSREIKNKPKPKPKLSKIKTPRIQPEMIFELDPPPDTPKSIFANSKSTSLLGLPRRRLSSPPVPALLKSLSNPNNSTDVQSSNNKKDLSPEEFYEQLQLPQEPEVDEEIEQYDYDEEEMFENFVFNNQDQDQNQDRIENEYGESPALLELENENEKSINQDQDEENNEENNDEEEYNYSLDEFTGGSSSTLSSICSSRTPSPIPIIVTENPENEIPVVEEIDEEIETEQESKNQNQNLGQENDAIVHTHVQVEVENEEIRDQNLGQENEQVIVHSDSEQCTDNVPEIENTNSQNPEYEKEVLDDLDENEIDNFPEPISEPPHITPIFDQLTIVPPPPSNFRLPLNYSNLDKLSPKFDLKPKVIKLQEIRPKETIKLRFLSCTSRSSAINDKYYPPEERSLKFKRENSYGNRPDTKDSNYSMLQRESLVHYLNTSNTPKSQIDFDEGITEFSLKLPKNLAQQLSQNPNHVMQQSRQSQCQRSRMKSRSRNQNHQRQIAIANTETDTIDFKRNYTTDIRDVEQFTYQDPIEEDFKVKSDSVVTRDQKKNGTYKDMMLNQLQKGIERQIIDDDWGSSPRSSASSNNSSVSINNLSSSSSNNSNSNSKSIRKIFK